MHPSPEAPFCLPCRKKGYSDLKMLKEGGVWKCIVNDREAPIVRPLLRAYHLVNGLASSSIMIMRFLVVTIIYQGLESGYRTSNFDCRAARAPVPALQ